MQVTEKRNFMDIFLYKLFYPFTIREKYFMFLVFLDYRLRYI